MATPGESGDSGPTTKRKTADLKIVLIGSSYVGKTCLVTRYVSGSYDENCLGTIGASFLLKQWGPHNIAIWDTAGQERFSGLSSFYCRGAGAAILAFDLTSKESFADLEERFLPLLSGEPNCLKIVVGTKLDLLDDGENEGGNAQTIRGISSEAGRAFAKSINEDFLSKNPKFQCPYFETSSKTNTGVDKLFAYIFEVKFGKLSPEYSSTGGYKSSKPSREDTVRLHDDAQPTESEKKCKC